MAKGAPINTTCAYCGVGCGIAAQVKGAREVTIKGDKTHPANHGRLCSKGTYLGETLELEGRLLHPMLGERRASWDEALDDVAERLQSVIAEHGPESVAFYVSGQLLTEDYYVANKLAKGFIGTGTIDTNSRLCMASAVAAHNRAFGEDVVPCSYEDLDCADLVVLVGSNTAWCHPVIWQRIEKLRERRGTKLVVIDPRRTETAALADLHIPVAPDGDIALFNALLDAVAKRGGLDAKFLRDQCEVPEGFFAGLSGEHGVNPQIFAKLVDLLMERPRMLTLFSQGANQSACGTDKGNAIINFHLATGRINRLGAGPFSITGQPNAMGGREVGGLANTLACHLGFSEDERADVAGFWKTDRLCSGQGLKAVDLFRAVHEGRIKFLWVMATNPAVSMPDAGFVREALARCPNIVVSDVIADTDTAKFAHVRLPALGWAEKDGTVTNSERRVSRQRALLAAPGEARADWRIVCDVAARLGHGRHFDFTSPAAIFREYAAMTALAGRHGKKLDLTQWADCSDRDYERMLPFQWGGTHPLRHGFATSDGKARLIAVTAPKTQVDGMVLNTGRYRDQWHTMTRTGLSPSLSVHRREPLVEVHPADAERLALEDGGLACVSSAAGESIYRVAVSDGQVTGQIFVPMHFTDANSGGGRTGLLVEAKTDPVSGQPAFKNVAADIAPWQPEWRAFLLTRTRVQPDCTYWAQMRVKGGWLTELAGLGAVDIDALLPEGMRREVADIARGMRRVTVGDEDGQMLAALYLTRSGELPARDWIVRQFAAPDASDHELLAGRPAIALPDRGKVVCVCHDVGENTIREAAANGANTVQAVGEATCAGTNCGSCRTLIAQIIEETDATVREAAE
ncbi:nitrate reductase [Alteraurantiacibacter aquimixticola]|uniref:Nitrate reductase n=1 Tax=Alteraurantiacibacter aquimixticola TaxID=2489173 RepID=A0A4T3F6E4_9SPHN|nr:nitrate reductase [Alteraurantiacibacter aquimixticola]TIX51232.1 nitrate reductase [Alteraurantiacibacter aquimixticola]